MPSVQATDLRFGETAKQSHGVVPSTARALHFSKICKTQNTKHKTTKPQNQLSCENADKINGSCSIAQGVREFQILPAAFVRRPRKTKPVRQPRTAP
jgi:hypothetical protein